MNLDARLEESSVYLFDMELCHVRLVNNSKFPWLLLIPRRDSLREIIDLASEEQTLLMNEISVVSQIIKNLFQPEKLNVAALGNVVPQLHIHVIARYTDDSAWPNPVWNSGDTIPYQAEELDYKKAQLISAYHIYKNGSD